MSETDTLKVDCRRALQALYIAVDKTVADDINGKIGTYIVHLECELAEAKIADLIKREYERAEAKDKQIADLKKQVAEKDKEKVTIIREFFDWLPKYNKYWDWEMQNKGLDSIIDAWLRTGEVKGDSK